MYYNFRHYSPYDGRWISRDPIAEQGGYNLYHFVNNRPNNRNDLRGLILYALDGTSTNASHNGNVWRFHGLAMDPKDTYLENSYEEGPNLSGSASAVIRDIMLRRICCDYCYDNTIPINFVGWSRGGAIAIEVAYWLKKNGCMCKNKKKHDFPKINWIGLFDPVDMTKGLHHASTIPDNVIKVSILRNDGVDNFIKETLFKKVVYTIENPTITSVKDLILTGATHNDVGGWGEHSKVLNRRSFTWMYD